MALDAETLDLGSNGSDTEPNGSGFDAVEMEALSFHGLVEAGFDVDVAEAEPRPPAPPKKSPNGSSNGLSSSFVWLPLRFVENKSKSSWPLPIGAP